MTFRNYYPRLSEAIEQFVAEHFESVSAFTKQVGIPRSRYYAILRNDEKGTIPRLDLITSILNRAFLTSKDAYNKLHIAMVGDMAWQYGKKVSVRRRQNRDS